MLITKETQNITTQNLVPEGEATANSAATIYLNGSYSKVGIHVDGTYTGALTVQATLDNQVWFDTADSPIPSGANGFFEVKNRAYLSVRVTALSAVTGTAEVTLTALGDIDSIDDNTPAMSGAIRMYDENFEKLYLDLQKANSEPVDIMFITDSIGHITGVDGSNWLNKMEQQLAAIYNSNDNTSVKSNSTMGYYFASPTTPSNYRPMATRQGTDNINVFGAQGTTLASASSHYCEQTATCDGVIVLWKQGTGTLTVRDGGAAGTIVATIDTSTGTAGASNMTSIDLGTYASRAIHIQATAGNPILEGIYCTAGNLTKGVRIWTCSRYAYSTAFFYASATRYADFIDKIQVATGKPVHVIVGTGINEGAGAYPTNIANIMGVISGKTQGALGLWLPWGKGLGDDVAKLGRAIAAENNYGLIDANRALGDIAANGDINVLSTDNIHPNDLGIAMLAAVGLATISGDPIASAMKTVAMASRYIPLDYIAVGGGRLLVAEFFGIPIFQMYNAAADVNPCIQYYPANLAAGLGYPSSGLLQLGAGGASAISATLSAPHDNVLATKAGGSASSVTARLGGRMSTNTTTVGNVGTGEDDLMTYSVPAATLSADGQSIRFRMLFTTANNANAKQIRVRFGSTVIYASGALPTSAAGEAFIEGEIYRTGAATQRAFVQMRYTGGTFSGTPIDITAPTETLANALTLKMTGEAVSNNDIQQTLMTVDFHPQ